MLVGTGAVVTGTAAGETVRYTVVVRGDVNGDGRQTATDYLRTKRAVLKIEALEGVYYEAAACFDGRTADRRGLFVDEARDPRPRVSGRRGMQPQPRANPGGSLPAEAPDRRLIGRRDSETGFPPLNRQGFIRAAGLFRC